MIRERQIKVTYINSDFYRFNSKSYTVYELFDHDRNFIGVVSGKYLWNIIKYLHPYRIVRHEYYVAI